MEKVKEVIGVILSDVPAYHKTLNYAVEYCRYAMGIENEEEMQIQVLYILNNLSTWRHPRAKEVRQVLRNFTKKAK